MEESKLPQEEIKYQNGEIEYGEIFFSNKQTFYYDISLDKFLRKNRIISDPFGSYSKQPQQNILHVQPFYLSPFQTCFALEKSKQMYI